MGMGVFFRGNLSRELGFLWNIQKAMVLMLMFLTVCCREVVVGREFDNVRYRLDCHSCLLVEIGERANYLGLPCETCGRKPRSI